MSFKTYMKYSVLKAVGEIMFYIGVALTTAGVGVWLVLPPIMSFFGWFIILLTIIGVVNIIAGYIIHKYGMFKENAEQIKKGVQSNHDIPPPLPPPPSNICPTCHHPLTFIDQYQAWYCFNCKEYK